MPREFTLSIQSEILRFAGTNGGLGCQSEGGIQGGFKAVNPPGAANLENASPHVVGPTVVLP